jgi:hypothetical protein
VIDLASGSRQLLCASLIQAVAVRAGVARTPAGVLLGRSSGGQAQVRLARREAGEQGVELRACGGPLEWLGDLVVVVSNASIRTASAVEVGEVTNKV